MVFVRIAAVMRRKKKPQDPMEDMALSRRQSWRRQGGVLPGWKSLDTGPFSDGQEYDRTRLEAWLTRYEAGTLIKKQKWVWRKLSANGFRVVCSRVTGDENPEEICLEDVLGVMCSHAPAEKGSSDIDSPHETAAYFRRTNLHASEDAADIQSLVAGVEAEYVATPQAAGKPIALLSHPLTDRDFAILTTKMGFYRYSTLLASLGSLPILFHIHAPSRPRMIGKLAAARGK